MSKLIINANSIYDRVIRIGRQTENLVSEITFNVQMWIDEYGTGECVLNVKRNGDANAYPVPMTIVDGMTTWTITDTDTSRKGRGEIQLKYTVGEKVKTSPIFTISCGESLIGDGEPPSGYEDWLSELNRMTFEVEAAKTSASASAQAAQTAAGTAAEKASEAEQSATTASGFANNASASATSASTSAQAAAQSAQAASVARTAAEAAAISAQAEAEDAEAAKTAAQTAETGATASAQTASTKASEATASAQSAASSAQIATDKATLATNKAQAASESATLATAKANAAATSETNATTAAQTATTKASEAAASATSAQEYDESAQQSAVNAQASATNAAASEAAAKSYAEDSAAYLGAYPTDTAEGEIASFPDGADDVPMVDVLVNIDPVQDLSHGEPSPGNICPISGWTEVGVTRTGKNLLELSPTTQTINGVTFTVNDDGTISLSGTATQTTNYFLSRGERSFHNGSFVLSGCPSGGGASTYYLRIDNATGGNIAADYGDGKQFTISDGKIYTVFINVKSGVNTNGLVFKPMIELGSAATAYEPYTATSITIALGQTVYGGKLDVLSGELVIDRAMVDLGALDWAAYSAGVNTYRTKITTKAFGDLNLICSAYKTAASAFANMTNGTIRGTTGNAYVYVRDNNYTDVTSFKSAMTGQTLVYELAEPIEIQLSANQLNSLYGANNIWADSGDTTVEYRADTSAYIAKKIAEAISALS